MAVLVRNTEDGLTESSWADKIFTASMLGIFNLIWLFGHNIAQNHFSISMIQGQ
jgi:hypothetical protein